MAQGSLVNIIIIISIVVMVIYHMILIFTIICLEILHQLKKSYRYTDKRMLAEKRMGSMTLADFDKAVARGRKYVIFDNFIIDVEKFIGEHPGGSVMISHHIGRDIGKYIYGAYSLEKYTMRHKHSYFAVKVMTSLAVARLEDDGAGAVSLFNLNYITISLIKLYEYIEYKQQAIP